MTDVLQAHGLGKKYGRRGRSRTARCRSPPGGWSGLVGPNGAGKSTFLNLAVGMLTPSAGQIEVLGARPTGADAQRAKVGLRRPGHPDVRRAERGRPPPPRRPSQPRLGRRPRPGPLARLRLDPEQTAGRLSGGQRAQLALTLGIAKRPELLLLDEPVASLDPLARREFLQDLMEAVADQELSVVLSSHLVSDVERACDYLVVLVDSRVQVAGDIERAAGHPPPADRSAPGQHAAVPTRTSSRPATPTGSRRTSSSTEAPIHDPAWEVSALTLEDLVLAYMGGADTGTQPPGPGGVAMIWLTWRQFRMSALVLLSALAAGLVVLTVTGPQLSDLWREAGDSFFDRLGADRGKTTVFYAGTWVVYALPAVVGVFWGAPMVARELEAGTHRLVWTQSITRTRWLATKLGVAGAGAAIVGLAGLALTWWCGPIDDAVAQGTPTQACSASRGCGRRCSAPAASCRWG